MPLLWTPFLRPLLPVSELPGAPPPFHGAGSAQASSGLCWEFRASAGIASTPVSPPVGQKRGLTLSSQIKQAHSPPYLPWALSDDGDIKKMVAGSMQAQQVCEAMGRDTALRTA